jgi:hypothetical protein
MRALVPIACFLLCGCEFSPPANPFSKEVWDKSGTNRLALIYISTGRPDPKTEHFDFHSLAWQTKSGTNWSDHVVIAKAEFEATSPRRPWISDIYSIDPSTSTAIIKVAEQTPPTNGRSVCIYSWREWSLATNAEVRLIRVCKEPFEPYKGKRVKIPLF